MDKTRRNIVKAFTASAFLASSIPLSFASDPSNIVDSDNKRVLILYFSQTHRTEHLANLIHQNVGGTLLKVEPEVPYQGSYNELTVIAKTEQRKKHRPHIATKLPDLTEYDIVMLGFPTWWSTMPMLMFSVLEQNDFTGKTLIPFVTHGGSGLARSPKDIQKLYPENKVLSGLEIYGDDVKDLSTKERVNQWIDELGLARR